MGIAVSIGSYSLKKWAYGVVWNRSLRDFRAFPTLDAATIIMGILLLAYLSLQGEESKEKELIEEE